MGSDWTPASLGEMADLKNGKGLKNSFYKDSGKYPVWGANGQIARTDELLNEQPVIVIGRVGAYCGSIHAVFEANWVTDNAIIAMPKEGNDFRFLFYLLKHLKPERTSIGSAQPLVTQTGLKTLKHLKPPFPEQRAIAHILGSLDDKIELNRRMNQALEATARAIFKSWFVDFDPVRENMKRKGATAQGRKDKDHDSSASSRPGVPALPSHILDLFPDSFEDSELGEIPKKWEVVTFEELIDAKQGKYIPKNKMTDMPSNEYAYPVWGGNGIRGYAAAFMYKQPVVVLTCRGSNCGRIDLTESPAWISNIAFACSPKYGSVNFINVYLAYSSLTDTITGSAQPQITYTSLKNKRMLFPVHKEVCDAYSDYIDRMYMMIRVNNRQSSTLASLRDTLLPKLISGELRVPDAEKFVEEAGL